MHYLSQVLLIHYKRFEVVKQDEEFVSVKIHEPIAANPDLYLCGQKYDLVGVLVHAGESANSGHYFFDTVCPPYKTTRLAYRSNNDDTPRTISMETLIGDVNNAYMLAYQKAAEQPGEQPAVCVPPPPPPAADVPAPTEKTPTQHKAKLAADTTTQNATQDEKYFKDLLVQ